MSIIPIKIDSEETIEDNDVEILRDSFDTSWQ